MWATTEANRCTVKEKLVLNFMQQIVYVQIEKNSFSLFHVQADLKQYVKSALPFSTDRLAIGNFKQAEETLRKSLTSVYPNSIFKVSPIVVMHQLYLAEGGLCEVEERVLRELALGAGARQVYIWSGHSLTKEQLLGKVYARSI